MSKHFISMFLFSAFILFSAVSFAQSDNHVIHVQTNKLTAPLFGDDAKAFDDMLQRQADVISKDHRLVSFRAVRHSWGADSRDLVFISEFNNMDDMFSFYDDFGPMLEKAFSKEQNDKDNELYGKFVGQHADEIYHVIAGTK